MSTTGEMQQTADAAAKDLHEYLLLLIKQAASAYLAQEQLNFDVEQLPMALGFSAQASFGDYSMPVMAGHGMGRQENAGAPTTTDRRSAGKNTARHVCAHHPGGHRYKTGLP